MKAEGNKMKASLEIRLSFVMAEEKKKNVENVSAPQSLS